MIFSKYEIAFKSKYKANILILNMMTMAQIAHLQNIS